MPQTRTPPRNIEEVGIGLLCLAVRMNLSARSMYRWVKGDPVSGVTVPMPSHKVGRRLFFIPSEVNAWLRLYGPSGECRIEDASDDAPIPSAKITRRAKRRSGSASTVQASK
jgi:hypothetical protein